MLLKNGLVYTKDCKFEKTDLVFDKNITSVGADEGQGLDVSGCYVIPGLIDMHTHGAMLREFDGGNDEEFHLMAEYYVRKGVTGFMATTTTVPEKQLIKAMHGVRDYVHDTGAKCLGAYSEGVFFSYAKRGAHQADLLLEPDADMVCRLNDAAGGRLRLVAVSPELPGAMDFIKRVSGFATVTLAHTACDYDTALRGFEAGARNVTHLYNGMNSFLHRAPGLVGAALDSGATVELICDGLHVHPSVMRGTFKMFDGRLALITDSIMAAGVPEGDYTTVAGMSIHIRDNLARLDNGTIAGSIIGLGDGLRNSVKFGYELEKAVYAATAVPAKIIGVYDRVGSLEKGKAADITVLDKDLNVKYVFVDGKKVV